MRKLLKAAMAYALEGTGVECRHCQCEQKNLDQYRKECFIHPSPKRLADLHGDLSLIAPIGWSIF